ATFYDQTDTNHKLRWELYNHFLTNHAPYVQALPSRGWIHEVRSATRSEVLSKLAGLLSTPTLLVQAGKDHYVDMQAQNRFVQEHRALTSNRIRKIRFADAYHSVWRGHDYERVLEEALTHFRRHAD